MPSAPHCTLRITCSAALLCPPPLPSLLCFILLAPYCTPLLCLTLPLLALLYSALLCPALHFSPLLWLGFLSYNCAVIHSVQSCLILPSLSCLFFLARFCSVLFSCSILPSFTLQNSALLMSVHVCSAAHCPTPWSSICLMQTSSIFIPASCFVFIIAITFSYQTLILLVWVLVVGSKLKKASRFSYQS